MAEYKTATLGDTVYFGFGSNDTSGSGDDGAGPLYDVRLRGAAAGAAPVDSGGASRLTHVNYPGGSHEVAIAATAGNGFAAGNEYGVYCTLLVDAQNPTGYVGSFRLVSSGSPAESTVEIAAAVWDRVLSAALHNIPNSAGRRLRQLDPDLFPVWYVDGVGGNDANDGDSPDAPFLTIGAALAVVGAGQTIVVGAATYAEAGLDLDVASITLDCARGTIITGGGGTCLVVTAANCIVINGLYRPPGANIGIDIQAGGDDTLLMNCRVDTCSVGYDVNASRCAVISCRSIDHSVTGFDISGDRARFEHCDAMGSAAVRGFYLSANTADNNEFHDCHTLGNTTAGWEVVAGANNNCFAFCAMADSDGARVDNGTDNGWGGYGEEPLLLQADILNDATPFAGGNIDALVSDAATPAEVATALTDIGLDHLLHLAHPTGVPTANTLFDLIMSKDAGQNFARANDSLEAVRDQGDTAWATAAGFAIPGSEMNLADGAITAAKIAAAAFVAAKFGADFLTNVGLAASAVDEIVADILATPANKLATDAAGRVDVGDIEGVDATDQIRDAIVDDGTRFSGADIDTNIGSRSSHTAASVWTVGARTLTSFGTLAADVWGYVTRTLTSGAAPTVVQIDTQLSGSHGAGSWTSAMGAGAKAVTVNVVDGDGNPVINLDVTVKNDAQTTNIGSSTTGPAGDTLEAWGLDPVTDYKAVITSTVNYTAANPYSFTTGAGAAAQTVTLVVTAVSITPPADPTLCRVYAYMKEVETGVALGAGDGSLNAVEVVSRPTGATVVYGDGIAARETDAAGLVYVDIVRGATVQLKGTWTGTPSAGREKYVTLAVPDAATYDVGADLQS